MALPSENTILVAFFFNSQFFILTKRNGCEQLDNKYVVFGIIIKGYDIIKKIENQIANGNQNRVIYTIPLVFHVLHNGGPENISRAQIEDAVALLNRDYRLQNADANNVQSVFAGMPADIEIEFQLALNIRIF